MLGAHRGGNSLAYLLLGFRMAGFARFNQKNEASSRYMKRKLIAFLLAVAPFSLAQAQQQLAGDDLQKAVAGKTVFIDTPLGEVPVRYAANGSVSARTELALLDGESTTVDRGRWWVSESKLCLQWRNWMGGKTHCFTMHRLSPTVVRWRRDDGKSGIARLG
jgi:hypothetical protein